MEQRHNPFRVGTRLGTISQGSSFLATLGFGPESLWDSCLRPDSKDACKEQRLVGAIDLKQELQITKVQPPAI
jgi:hypothetical protein